VVVSKRHHAVALERLLSILRSEGITNPVVLDAMARVPRHQFLEEALAHRAYENTALPIGDGQTISQPYIVARMTEVLVRERMPGRVLEIGTGSGYQTAVLARLAKEVYTVERIPNLQYQARRRLRTMELHNIHYRTNDGWLGWPTKAPFDAIIVTAAPAQIPPALPEQLAVGGVLVIPVGGAQQMLRRVVRTDDGFLEEELEPVRFVPLIKDD